MTITRSAHPSAVWPGVKAWFGKNYDSLRKEYSQVFAQESSDKAYEKVVETTGFGLASLKTEGGSTAYDTDAEGITNVFTHAVYGLGYIVTEEELEDNQYEEVSMRRSTALGFSMNQTQEIVHANIFNRGFSGSYTFGDGVAFFSSSHPTRSGNQSNLLTAADISESAIEDAVKVTFQMTNARGLKIGVRPARLIHHTDDTFNVQRILKSELRQGTANNDINALRAMGSIPETTAMTFLTDNDAWYIQTNVPEGMKTMWRRKVNLSKDDDFDTNNAKTKATMRFAAGFGDWRCMLGSAGA